MSLLEMNNLDYRNSGLCPSKTSCSVTYTTLDKSFSLLYQK